QLFDVLGLVGRRFNQKEIISLLAGEEVEEISLGKNQLALKNAVLKQSHDAKPDNILAALIGSAAFVRNFQNVSQLFVQHPLGGRGVGDHRNDVVLNRLL